MQKTWERGCGIGDILVNIHTEFLMVIIIVRNVINLPKALTIAIYFVTGVSVSEPVRTRVLLISWDIIQYTFCCSLPENMLSTT